MRTSPRSLVLAAFSLAALLGLAPMPALHATTTPPAGVLPSGPPAWWAARGIADILAGSATASVTEAQLYQVALAAQAELEAKLPNGAGANITAEVTGWLNAPVPGLHAEYFPNLTLTGTPALAQQESPDHDWGWNQAPGIAGLQAGQFSARWSGQLEVPANGNYLFEADGAGGVRLWVNGALAIDGWDIDHPMRGSKKTTAQWKLHHFNGWTLSGQITDAKLETP